MNIKEYLLNRITVLTAALSNAANIDEELTIIDELTQVAHLIRGLK